MLLYHIGIIQLGRGRYENRCTYQQWVKQDETLSDSVLGKEYDTTDRFEEKRGRTGKEGSFRDNNVSPDNTFFAIRQFAVCH